MSELNTLKMNAGGDVTFTGNSSGKRGGAFASTRSSTVTLDAQNILFSGNSSGNGGAMWLGSDETTVNGATVELPNKSSTTLKATQNITLTKLRPLTAAFHAAARSTPKTR